MTSFEQTLRWSDPAALQRAVARESGIEYLRGMKEGRLPPPPIAASLGMQIDAIGDGFIRFSMPAERWMSNPGMTLHGGMTATLLDTVLTLAIVTKLPAGTSAQTTPLNLHYVRPVHTGGERIVAEGEAVHVGTTMATAQGRVFAANGKLVAHGTGTFAVIASTGRVT